jgi:hypothetical protein
MYHAVVSRIKYTHVYWVLVYATLEDRRDTTRSMLWFKQLSLVLTLQATHRVDTIVRFIQVKTPAYPLDAWNQWQR